MSACKWVPSHEPWTCSAHGGYRMRLDQEQCSPSGKPASIDAARIQEQQDWSRETFGPGSRLQGVLDHIRKELREIESHPTDLSEWVDVIILAIDGAWRAGYTPQEIIDQYIAKMKKNYAREWPDWRTMPPDKAIEHVRGFND